MSLLSNVIVSRLENAPSGPVAPVVDVSSGGGGGGGGEAASTGGAVEGVGIAFDVAVLGGGGSEDEEEPHHDRCLTDAAVRAARGAVFCHGLDCNADAWTRGRFGIRDAIRGVDENYTVLVAVA
ncbi:hypothetical protein Tdes44962_MAKER06181 [Teratosphaeria destructans]|uniref:Uncharacterized protein n=1 Tax=Teratosphaeria destructans TaxID=418781 RepID=A0A9W7VXX0_9PEZI|nr:hypothetical protein Tdes44962_MAKER06181 [Teratosphaeria destructans]